MNGTPRRADQSLASVAGAENVPSRASVAPEFISSSVATRTAVTFVTNFCPHYRVQTFEKLARKYTVHFHFFSQGTEWYWLKQLGVREGDFQSEYPHKKNKSTRVLELIRKLWRAPCDVYVKCINGRIALPVTYVIARLRGKPFILWTGIWQTLQTPFHRLIFPITRFVYRHSDAAVVYGDHVKRYLITQGVDEKRIFVAPHAVENECYSRPVHPAEIAALRVALNLVDNERTILYVGRLESLKGIEFLLQAFAEVRMPRTSLLLVGQGAQSERLAALAKALGIIPRVRFVGYIPPEDTVKLYALSYVLVLPSISTPRFREPWGLVINEAMNQGLPVITTDAVGAAAGGLVRNGYNGLIVPERDPKALAEALRTLLDSASLRQKMGQAALESIRPWDNDAMVEGFSQAIEFALENNAQTSEYRKVQAVSASARRLEKSARLLRLLAANRAEFFERITAILNVQCERLFGKPPLYSGISAMEDGIAILGRILETDIEAFLHAKNFRTFEEGMLRAKLSLPKHAPMGLFHNGDDCLARVVYALARAVRPNKIVETGVCYGVTTAYLLRAICENGSGHLHSIDLPPLAGNADSFVGYLVPQDLKIHWTLHRGSSRRLLSQTLPKDGNLQMFVHDSSHTRANMRREFATAWPFMSPGSVLVSDDIEGNTAFAELASMPGVKCSVILASKTKTSLVGIVIKS